MVWQNSGGTGNANTQPLSGGLSRRDWLRGEEGGSNLGNETIVGILKTKDMSVEVVRVANLEGYRFDAVGIDSLSLATELAILQTQKGISRIDRLLNKGTKSVKTNGNSN